MLFGKKPDQNQPPQAQQDKPAIDPKTVELAKQVDRSIIFHFAYPHKIDKQLLERFNPYVGWDAATSYLDEDDLAVQLLGLKEQENLQFAFGLTIEEVNKNRLAFIIIDLQAEDTAYIRLRKSLKAKLLDLAPKTIFERRDVLEHNADGKRNGFWGWL
ncbi:MAG: hypothetical protein DRN30_06820 [Thermoplasmata archaeon]|nr:MAG: hypothetical protein DRN30_06820 [Thermoplasmata archaeon]